MHGPMLIKVSDQRMTPIGFGVIRSKVKVIVTFYFVMVEGTK